MSSSYWFILSFFFNFFLPNGKETIDQAFRSSDVVFLGKVISITTYIPDTILLDNTYDVCVFEVFDVYKGRKRSNRVKVLTYTLKKNMCMGYNFELNKTYVVYATARRKFYTGDKKRKKFLLTKNCDRTTANLDEVKMLEEYLNKSKR